MTLFSLVGLSGRSVKRTFISKVLKLIWREKAHETKRNGSKVKLFTVVSGWNARESLLFLKLGLNCSLSLLPMHFPPRLCSTPGILLYGHVWKLNFWLLSSFLLATLILHCCGVTSWPSRWELKPENNLNHETRQVLPLFRWRMKNGITTSFFLAFFKAGLRGDILRSHCLSGAESRLKWYRAGGRDKDIVILIYYFLRMR